MLKKITAAINNTFSPSTKYVYEWKPIYRMNFLYRDNANFKRHHLVSEDLVITNKKDDMTMMTETTWPYCTQKAQEMLCCFYQVLWGNICNLEDDIVVHIHRIGIQNYDGSEIPDVIDKRQIELYLEYTLSATNKHNVTTVIKNVILFTLTKDPESKNVYRPSFYTESDNENSNNVDIVILSFYKTLETLILEFQPEVINRPGAAIIDIEYQGGINKFFFGDTQEYMVVTCFNRLYLDKKIVSSKHKSDYYNKPNTQKIRKLYYRSFMEELNRQLKKD